MGGLTDNLKGWWGGSGRSQRMMTLGGLIALVFLLFIVAMIVIRPRYVTLFANLNDGEQATVAADLQNLGFDVKADRPGLIEVPYGEKDSARIRLAAANKLPKAQGQWGLGELNNMPFGVTPNVESERIKAIAEGEIAKSIEAMDGVQSARVHLTLPTQSVFADQQKSATASVSIVESSDSDLTANQGRAIALLVKNAVDGLDTKDIVVVNQHLKTIWNGEDEGEGGLSGADRKTDIDASVSRDRQRELQSLLDGAFGAGAALVTVHADVDMNPEKTTTDEKIPSGASATQNSSEVVVGGSRGAAGAAGLAGNLPGAPAAGATGGAGNYTGKTDTKENLVSETQTEKSKALGSIQAMAINVIVDSTRISDPKAVENILLGDLGDRIKVDATGKPLPGQPYTYKVTSVEFDKTAAKEADAADKAAASQARIQQIVSLLPIGALLIVAGMVLKQIAKFTRSNPIRPVTMPTESFELALPGGGTMADSASLNNLLAQIQGSAEPSQMGGRSDEPAIEVEDIKNRVHIPLEQLKKMANERPSLVAQLIKSMLLEERK